MNEVEVEYVAAMVFALESGGVSVDEVILELKELIRPYAKDSTVAVAGVSAEGE